MTGDKIVAVIATIGMLSLVVPRLVNNPGHRQRLLKMAGLWVLVIAVVTVVVVTLR